MTQFTKYVFGLMTILSLFIGMSLFSILKLEELSKETENMYNHPFTVSSAVKEINIHLISMQRSLKDVLLSKEKTGLQDAIADINMHERAALQDFSVVFQRYLGDKRDIEIVYDKFNAWEQYREEIITLVRVGNMQEALRINKTKGAEHISELLASTQTLLEFASHKAQTFQDHSIINKEYSLKILSVLLLLISILTVLISAFILNRIKESDRKVQQHFQQIDQNIMMVYMDAEGSVTDATNALCRRLETTKPRLIDKNGFAFIADALSPELDEKIWNQLHTGKSWSGDVSRIDSEGETQWFNLDIHPVHDEQYAIISYTNIITDITAKKKIEEMSIRDKLTGLYNRRFFDEIIDQQIQLACRDKKGFTFAMIDIDNFKKYNDNYGHPAGDKALIRVANVMKQAMQRPNDYLFRLGGEEFGVIFNGADTEASYEYLELIRKSVASLAIEHAFNQEFGHITISIGAKVIQGEISYASEQLYLEADELLYKAKERRDETVVE